MDNGTPEYWFDHEWLEVYRKAIDFIAWLSSLLEETSRIGEVKDQLDRASTSIALNIAEGNGKFSPKDRCRFFDTAHGSALECAAGLDVLVARGKLLPSSRKRASATRRADAHRSDQEKLVARLRTYRSSTTNEF